MKLVSDAVNAVQRNLGSLALFVVVAVGWNSLAYVADSFVGRPKSVSDINVSIALYTLFRGLAGIAVLQLVATVVFTAMGREIDRPLWKVADLREGVRRFFPIWFTIGLIGWTMDFLSQVFLLNDSTRPLSLTFLLLVIVYAVISTPIGACIMFQGKFRWEHFGEALNPLIKSVFHTLTIAGLTIFQTGIYLYVLLIASTDQAGFQPREFFFLGAASVINTYLECVVFASVWIVCMIDRDTYEEVDIDF